MIDTSKHPQFKALLDQSNHLHSSPAATNMKRIIVIPTSELDPALRAGSYVTANSGYEIPWTPNSSELMDWRRNKFAMTIVKQ